MAVTGLTLVKKFEYRGDPNEEFANTYWFKNLPPGDDPSWMVLMNDIVVVEQKIYPAAVQYVRAYGYNNEDLGAPSVFHYEWPVGGGYGGSGTATGTPFAGDQAACIEWPLDIKNARGKVRYLRKYQHSGYTDPADSDSLSPTYLAELETYANAMRSQWGGMTAQQHPSLNTTGHKVIPWVTTRTLKRRGKRPLPAS